MYEDDSVDDSGLSRLRAASSIGELQRLLVTRRLDGRSGRHREAVELFLHYHGDDPSGAVDTAVLLCTEGRWDRCTAQLIAGICATGILDDPALDELADRLLWPDRPLVRHPLSWLGLEWIEIDVEDGSVVGRGVDTEHMVDNERPRARPPLLRWAAAHLLRRRQTTLAKLRRRAAKLDAHHGPPVIAGILDAIDWLPEDDARRAIDLGLASGLGQVRKVALRAVADRGNRADAVRRAQSDPDASIRRWASELEGTPTTLF